MGMRNKMEVLREEICSLQREISALEKIGQMKYGIKESVDGMNVSSRNKEPSQGQRTPQTSTNQARRMHGILSTPIPDPNVNYYPLSVVPPLENVIPSPITTTLNATSPTDYGKHHQSTYSSPETVSTATEALKLLQDQLGIIIGTTQDDVKGIDSWNASQTVYLTHISVSLVKLLTKVLAEQPPSNTSDAKRTEEKPTVEPALSTPYSNIAQKTWAFGVNSGAKHLKETSQDYEESRDQTQSPGTFKEAHFTFRAAVMSLSIRNENDQITTGKSTDPKPFPAVKLIGLSNDNENKPSTNRHSRPTEIPNNSIQTSYEPRSHYASDLTDRQWQIIESLTPAAKTSGRPAKYERREILNAIRYQLHSGCSWRKLPKDLPPWKIVHHYYRIWRQSGIWDPISNVLEDQLDTSVSAYETLPMWRGANPRSIYNQKKRATAQNTSKYRTEHPIALR